MGDKSKKIIGIIGGMGPMATCDLFSKIIMSTQAHRDQEHVHLIIDNDTDIPDRSAHILGQGEDPVPEIKMVIQTLIIDGAEILAMPCNTAHYYYPLLKAYAKNLNPEIEFVHMIDEVAIKCQSLGYKRLLLLSTLGTYKSGLYKEFFEGKGIDLIYPVTNSRQIVMDAIYAYKNNESIDKEDLKGLLNYGQDQAVDGIILGCTELPLIISAHETSLPLIDPALILAEKLAALGQGT